MADPDEAMTTCPTCGAAVAESERFCEACGAELTPTVTAADPALTEPSPPGGSTQEMPGPLDLGGTASSCQSCGGEVFSDGYCGTCGARAPSLRDHFTEQPAAWVAAVCDRGIRHTRNEDAVALAAEQEPGSRAVLVVCDGVSNTTDSDFASLAAARAARDVLASSRSRGMGTAHSLVAAVVTRLEAAADAAAQAVLVVTSAAKDVARVGNPAVESPASCTFVAAVIEQDLLVVGTVGDSRAYWLADSGTAAALTVDDSFAQEQIAAGVPRAEAETGPHSHAITRWLGADAPDHTPTTATMMLTEPGWLLVCSDGLWNYCSAAEDMSVLVHKLAAMEQPVSSEQPPEQLGAADSPASPGSPASQTSPASPGSPATADPVTLAGALVDWANTQGGQDNITVALARVDPMAAQLARPSRPAADALADSVDTKAPVDAMMASETAANQAAEAPANP